MADRTRLRRVLGILLAIAALTGQHFADFFTQELIAEAAILAIFSLSIDLLASTGLISLGHAGLLGVGAYGFAYLSVHAGLAPALALPLAIILGAITAFLVGIIAVRTSGAFFIMVTLALAEMMYSWAFRSKLFGGADGMGGIARVDLSGLGIDLDDPENFALAMILLTILLWLLMEVLATSPLGRTFNAIRQNPSRVAALGGRVTYYRLAAFTLSGAIAAFAGALKVQDTNFISPSLISWLVSGDVLISVVIGGIGTLIGGPLGAALLVALKNVLSSNIGHWYLFLGMIFAFVALVTPKGIIGTLLDWNDRIATRRAGRPS